MAERDELFKKAKDYGIEFKGNISNKDLSALIEKAMSENDNVLTVDELNDKAAQMIDDNDGATLEDLRLTADDLGIKYPSNATPKLLIDKITEVMEQNRLDDKASDDGKYFTAAGDRPCFILGSTFNVGTPYRLDEWENNKEFMIRFAVQVKSGTLELM